LSREFANTRLLRLSQKGCGGALKSAWSNSPADIFHHHTITPAIAVSNLTRQRSRL